MQHHKRTERTIQGDAPADPADPAATLFGVVGGDAPTPTERPTQVAGRDGAGDPSPAAATSAAPGPDPFDPARLRLSQRRAGGVGLRKRLTTVPVRKPSKEWFVRCHPAEEFRLETMVLELKDDRESYLVAPDLWDLLADEGTVSPRLLALTVTRSGTPFLWPIRLPGPDGKLDSWNESALEAAKTAESTWVRVSANMQLGAYDVVESVAYTDEPAWPAEPMAEILQVAFRTKRIDSMDHPVLLRLRGEA